MILEDRYIRDNTKPEPQEKSFKSEKDSAADFKDLNDKIDTMRKKIDSNFKQQNDNITITIVKLKDEYNKKIIMTEVNLLHRIDVQKRVLETQTSKKEHDRKEELYMRRQLIEMDISITERIAKIRKNFKLMTFFNNFKMIGQGTKPDPEEITLDTIKIAQNYIAKVFKDNNNRILKLHKVLRKLLKMNAFEMMVNIPLDITGVKFSEKI